MSKLCLSTYLSVLALHNSSKNAGQLKILNGLIKSICTKPEAIDKELTSHIRHGRRNLPQAIKDNLEEINYQNPHFLENFKSNVEIYLHPGKIIDICKTLRYIALNDDAIDDKSTIDFILQTKKSDLNSIERPLDFIAGVFLYVIRIENDKTKEYASEITKDYCEKAIKEYDILAKRDSSFSNNSIIKIVMDQDIPSQAKSFCRKHEESIELLPLCQIANIVNPGHNHVNKMYSDYCDYSNKLKEQIMKEIECPLIQVDNKISLYKLLGKFSEEIVDLGLIPQDKEYMFSQYVTKSLDYEKIEPIDINPPIFPIAPSKYFPNHKTSMLSQFIDDYLYYKDKDLGITLPVPFEWMIVNLELLDCPEKDLVHWLNLFVISSCYNIPKQISNKYESPKLPTLYDVKTIEDLHFLALLMLYDTYLCK